MEIEWKEVALKSHHTNHLLKEEVVEKIPVCGEFKPNFIHGCVLINCIHDFRNSLCTSIRSIGKLVKRFINRPTETFLPKT